MESGKLAIVLNAHLPFVRQPDYPRFLEERWLFESLSETYLPLLRMFARLEAEKIPWKLSLSLSPTLISMLGDELLKNRYVDWLNIQLELAEQELARTSESPEEQKLAAMYRDLYIQNRDDFSVLHAGNVLAAFDFWYKKGRLDLMTSAGTQAFLPIYRSHPEAISGQIESALVLFRTVFGKSPSGFWLPQLGWYPGLEEVLASYGFEYTLVSTRGALLGKPAPKMGSYAPVECSNGFTCFIRDVASTEEVWSEKDGYPSDPVYRDFYRDIGFDLPLDYIGPYVDQNQVRAFTGFKYHAVTGKDVDKFLYDPELAAARVVDHAENFLYNRVRQARKARDLMDEKIPLIVAPFDAELFGHWWFEGVSWLEAVFRKAQTTGELDFTSLADYHKENKPFEVSIPEFSSWGDGGYANVWIEKSNDWIYRHNFRIIDGMLELAERFPNESGLRERMLNQAAREVLLSQAADWPFLMQAGKAGPYARKQIEDAVSNFIRIYEMLCANELGTEWITRLEKRNNIFPNINYRMFRRKS